MFEKEVRNEEECKQFLHKQALKGDPLCGALCALESQAYEGRVEFALPRYEETDEEYNSCVH